MTATARKLAILFYNALRFGMTYVDPGVSSYEARYRQRVIHNLHRRAKSLGFSLVRGVNYFCRAADPIVAAHLVTASSATEGVS